MLSILTDPQVWASLIVLTILEIVLGVDNLVFLTIVTGRVDRAHRKITRQVGLAGACIMRILLLAAATWVIHLTYPAWSIFRHSFSWRDLFLLVGGLFLLYKGTDEIHAQFEEISQTQDSVAKKVVPFPVAIFQIMMLDIVFSLDSVFTAVGIAQEYWIMATAVIIAIAAMMFVSGPLGEFVEKHPSVKMLALSFLILVGALLVADGFSYHIPRGYIYFAIGFSISVEILNISLANKRRRLKDNLK